MRRGLLRFILPAISPRLPADCDFCSPNRQERSRCRTATGNHPTRPLSVAPMIAFRPRHRAHAGKTNAGMHTILAIEVGKYRNRQGGRNSVFLWATNIVQIVPISNTEFLVFRTWMRRKSVRSESAAMATGRCRPWRHVRCEWISGDGAGTRTPPEREHGAAYTSGPPVTRTRRRATVCARTRSTDERRSFVEDGHGRQTRCRQPAADRIRGPA